MKKIPRAVIRRLIALMVVSFPFVGSSFAPKIPTAVKPANTVQCPKLAAAKNNVKLINSTDRVGSNETHGDKKDCL